MRSSVTTSVTRSRAIRYSVIGFSAVAFLIAFAVQARAQDANPPSSENEPAQVARARTPMLIIHEVWTPAPETKPAPQQQARSQKTGKGAAGAKAREDTGPALLNANATGAPAAPAPMVMGASKLEYLSGLQDTTGNPAYDELARQAGARYGVDPNLIIAVMRQESGFNPRAVSYKGASGLMQLMPGTARRFGAVNIFDPVQNIDAGTRYLRFLLDTFNDDVSLALAGYNAGENAVINSGYRIPRYRETQNYVRSIGARYGAKAHRGGPKQIASTGPVAPEVVNFGAGGSTRLSNNY